MASSRAARIRISDWNLMAPLWRRSRISKRSFGVGKGRSLDGLSSEI